MMGYRFFFTLVILFIHFTCFSQHATDLKLILSPSQTNLTTQEYKPITKHKRIVPYLFKPGYLLFKHVLYNQMGLTCVYNQPCMDFCGELIERYGLVKGYFLSFDRIVRCNRLTPLETYPSGLTLNGKLIDSVSDYQN